MRLIYVRVHLGMTLFRMGFYYIHVTEQQDYNDKQASYEPDQVAISKSCIQL